MTDAPRVYRWEDLRVGLEQSFRRTVTEPMLGQFLAISADTNPLHNDTVYARRAGYPDLVVYGMLTAAFYSTLVGVYLPGRYCMLHAVDIAFVKPVFIGAELTVSGTITHLNHAYRQVQISAQIVDASAAVVSKAKIRAGVLAATEEP